MAKKLVLMMIIFLVANFGFSQNLKTIQKNEEVLSGAYEFNQALPKGLGFSKDQNGNPVDIFFERRIVILYTDETKVYFSYWYQKDEELNSLLNGEGPLRKVYSIEKSKFNDVTVPLYSRFKGFKTGAYTVPFRLRGVGDEFDFDPTISLTANIIAGVGSIYKERSWLDFSLGVGLSSVVLNSNNSDLIDENRTSGAFTLSLGALFKPEDYVNFGIFLGWDTLGKNDRPVNWIYDNKPWLGIGINISFNEINTDNAAKNKK